MEYLYGISRWLLNTYMNIEYLSLIPKLTLNTYMNTGYPHSHLAQSPVRKLPCSADPGAAGGGCPAPDSKVTAPQVSPFSPGWVPLPSWWGIRARKAQGCAASPPAIPGRLWESSTWLGHNCSRMTQFHPAPSPPCLSSSWEQNSLCRWEILVRSIPRTRSEVGGQAQSQGSSLEAEVNANPLTGYAVIKSLTTSQSYLLPPCLCQSLLGILGWPWPHTQQFSSLTRLACSCRVCHQLLLESLHKNHFQAEGELPVESFHSDGS